MRILIVGAGAVGVVLGQALEANPSNQVIYYVRAGRTPLTTKVLDVRSGRLHTRERAAAVEPKQPLPEVDSVILGVRADQLEEALALVPALPGAPQLATATPGLEDLARLRARFPGRPTALILPTFYAYPDGDTIRFVEPPPLRSFVSHENDASSRPFAEELAAELKRGGLRVRAVRSLASLVWPLLAGTNPLLASYELAGWDFGALARDAELRTLAARGMREAVRAAAATPAGVGVRVAARAPFGALVRATAAMPEAMRQMWRVHGPKIAGQTRAQLGELVARAHARGLDSDALAELRRRLPATAPPRPKHVAH